MPLVDLSVALGCGLGEITLIQRLLFDRHMPIAVKYRETTLIQCLSLILTVLRGCLCLFSQVM